MYSEGQTHEDTQIPTEARTDNTKPEAYSSTYIHKGLYTDTFTQR